MANNIKIMIIFLLVMHSSLSALDLKIICTLEDTTNFTIQLKSGITKIQLTESKKWEHALTDNDHLIGLSWDYYQPEKNQWVRYLINAQKHIPSLANGGTLVISKDGGFLYEKEKGKKFNYGVAQKIEPLRNK